MENFESEMGFQHVPVKLVSANHVADARSPT